MANRSIRCLTDSEMSLSTSQTERILTGYFVPFLILFGVTGNLINLTILVAPGMKTRSNFLLACLAVVDMLFLLSMAPHCFAHYQYFIYNYNFRVFYLKTKTHAVAFSNWFSAAAIWQKFLAVSTGYFAGRSNNAMNQSAAQMRLEQRVTLTVCAIVSCFIITQAPSAVFYLIAGYIQARSPNWHGILNIVTSFMVIFGKSLNFVLFCLSSATFRQRLVGMTKERIGGKRNVRRYSQEMELNTQTTAVHTGYSSRKNSESTTVYASTKNRSRVTSLNLDVSQNPIKNANSVQQLIQNNNGTML